MSQRSREPRGALRCGNFVFVNVTREWTLVSPNKTSDPSVSVQRDVQGPTNAAPRSTSGFLGRSRPAPTAVNTQEPCSGPNLGLPGPSQSSTYSSSVSNSLLRSAHQYNQQQGLLSYGVHPQQPLPALPTVDKSGSPLPPRNPQVDLYSRPRHSDALGQRERFPLSGTPSDRFNPHSHTSVLDQTVLPDPTTSRQPAFAPQHHLPLLAPIPLSWHQEIDDLLSALQFQTGFKIPALPSVPQSQAGSIEEYELQSFVPQAPHPSGDAASTPLANPLPTPSIPPTLPKSPPPRVTKCPRNDSEEFEDVVPSLPSKVDEDTVSAIKATYPSLKPAEPQNIQILWNIAGLLQIPFSAVVPKRDCRKQKGVECKWDIAHPCGQTISNNQTAAKRHLLEFHNVSINTPDMYTCLWDECFAEVRACNLGQHIMRTRAHGINQPFHCPFSDCEISCTALNTMIRHLENSCVETRAIHRHPDIQMYYQEHKDRNWMIDDGEDEDEEEPARKRTRRGD
ncbi:hypothetical protein ONZ45_g7701 [Pleurotus djamor]|nr:hypothetical protein ONZ45_g7701 [Pleurotus djamor]